jgi:betaine-aldehyde dehydrogenase
MKPKAIVGNLQTNAAAFEAQDMRIANEEIFGPVLSVLRWSDEQEMISQVNRVEYGLTCAIWTKDITRAHQLAQQV